MSEQKNKIKTIVEVHVHISDGCDIDAGEYTIHLHSIIGGDLCINSSITDSELICDCIENDVISKLNEDRSACMIQAILIKEHELEANSYSAYFDVHSYTVHEYE